MKGYILRRLLLAVPTLLGLSLLVFGLAVIAPGDPAEELARRRSGSGEVIPAEVERAREELGLDRPLAEQYLSWLGGAVRGDLGTSFLRQKPVGREILSRLRATAELAVAALLLSALLAVPFGVFAAAFHRRRLDDGLRLLALVGASVPSFFLAYVLIALFATRMGLFPVAGRQGLTSLVLPAVALSLGPIAMTSRLLRSSLLEVLGEDYIRAARSRGLSHLGVIVRHGLRNAAIPAITVLGTVFGYLLSQAVIVEFIFAWPGLGRLTLEAITQRDYPLLQGVIFFAGVVGVFINLAVDVTYRVIDPRVRLQAEA
ncbi:MAG: ABC transporter permease [Actinomycetota bacterium]|nr:ABC transporter permease [Actinomycetota bacterium]